jgi:hypothetical protein
VNRVLWFLQHEVCNAEKHFSVTLNTDVVLNSVYVTYYALVRFQVLTAASMERAVFWDAACSVL